MPYRNLYQHLGDRFPVRFLIRHHLLEKHGLGQRIYCNDQRQYSMVLNHLFENYPPKERLRHETDLRDRQTPETVN
tara:strand:- start:5843 stop:6070 length:228 start_codon:yes stop_codon:yes gene_type:complete